MSITDELLDNEQTAALLGIKPNTLEIWRHKGKGPEFLKLGDTPQAPVRYLRSEVTAWLRRRSFASTSAFTAAARLPTRQPICSPF
jgi:predicted DNA-binding transcriptional regulator AlpA